MNLFSPAKKSRSAFRTIVVPLLFLIVFEMLLLAGGIYTSGVISRLDRNAEAILDKQVETRRNYLEFEMVKNWSDLSLLAKTINQATQRQIGEGLDLSTLDKSSDACTPLLLDITEDLISTLYSKRVSGIFVVFNTQHAPAERLNHPSKPGIYIRDHDPSSTPSRRNADLLIKRAPIAVARALSIPTDASWQPLFDFNSTMPSGFCDSLFLPIEASAEANSASVASNYGYWGVSPFQLKGDMSPTISYSMPLMLEDGTVYGVLGIDLLTDYMRSIIPFTELFSEKQGSYLLAVEQEGDLSFVPALINGSVLRQSAVDSVQLTPLEEGYTLTVDEKSYYASVKYLSLYNSNTYFENQRWALIGAVQKDKLYHFSQQLTQTLQWVILLTFFIGIIGSLWVSRRLSQPIRALAQEVDRAQLNRNGIPHLPATGIFEIDRFSQEITALSRNVLDSSTRFLRIMEMASVELGGFEVRPAEQDIFVTDNFFSLFNREQPPSQQLSIPSFRKLIHEIYQDFDSTTNDDGSLLFRIPLAQDGVRYLHVEIAHDTNRYVGLVEDVTNSTLERLRIEHDRDYDLLTGLYNRRAFYRRLDDAFSRPEKLGHAALLMLDLDNLKTTNDRFGHDWGDQYIRKAGQCFVDALPRQTLCARVSGDEFLIFLSGYSSPEALREVLLSLRNAIHSSDFPLPNGESSRISASGGVAWYPTDGTDYNELIRFADFAMYQVKGTRKGELGDFDLGVYNQETFLLQSKRELKHLIEQKLLTYHFQPIFDAKTGAIYANEALMRIDMPTLRSPDAVLGLARREGKLQDIERLTWFLACESYQALRDQDVVAEHELLFINSIASQRLTDEDCQCLRQQYSALMTRTVIEITEAEDMDLEATRFKREALSASGLFALDDYGSGYNSEKNLLDLSPNFIKVDLSIIRNIDSDPDKQQIVSNIVGYAHRRGMLIIAEGLESAPEVTTVLELGVDLLQGYFLARPAKTPAPISRAALALIDDFMASAEQAL